jgi:hypothetical protein
MMRKAMRAAWLLPLAVLLALFTLRGAAGCRRKPSAGSLEVTPASKRPWITPLLTAPPAQPTPTLWRSDITRIPTLPE